MGLSFLAPVFLAGMLTAVIPVIIHLIHRRRTRTVPFSTLMFLRLSHERVARRKRLRELLLLLLRCAFLLLLACAFAGPVLRSHAAGDNPAVHVVLLVDDSYSMAYEFEGKTSFERLQEAAEGIIEALPRQSEVALLFSSGRGDREVPELSPNLLQIGRTVAASSPGATATPLGPALARAAKALSDAAWPNRELYVLTDLQKAAWQGVTGNDAAAFEDVTVVVVDCGSPEPANVAVMALDVRQHAGPGRSEVALSVAVQNFGGPSREVEVALRTGAPEAQLRAVESVSLPPGGSAQTSFREPVRDDVLLLGNVQSQTDALPIDDVRYFAVSGKAGVSVLLVGDGAGRTGRDEGANDLLYLRAALGVGASPFTTFVVSPADLPAMRLDEYAVVVAGQMTGLSRREAGVLRGFVQRGGGLVVFLGPDVSLSEYNALFATPDSEYGALLPAALGKVVEAPEDRRVSWDKVDESHPIFEVFAGAMAKELRFIRAQQYVSLQTVAEDAGTRGMRPLAHYADGQPAVVEGRCGAGRVVLFTTSCEGTWSNLPLRASFVPILHRTVAYLARQEARPADRRHVGEPIQFLFPGEAEPVSIEVTAPDGVRHVLQSQLDGKRNRATFDKTGLPGLYRIETGAEQTSVPPVVAVNVDVRESDLIRLQARKVEAFFPGAQVQVTGGVERVGVEALRRHEGIKLWGATIAFLVALGMLESLLASLFTPRRGPEGIRARSRDFVAGRAAPSAGEVEQ